MKQKYPQIDVNITLGISAELYRKVLDGDDLDAVIITQPPFANPAPAVGNRDPQS